MKMNKVMTVALTLALSLSMENAVFAEQQNPTPSNNTADIKVSYSASVLPPDSTYYVEVEWGSLEYTYDNGEIRKWNPDTLEYATETGTPKWTCIKDADKITVKNHSNVPVTASFAYVQTDTGITGSFSKDSITLDAPNSTYTPSGTVTLSLDGAFSRSDGAKKPVGTATVNIKGVDAKPAAVGEDRFSNVDSINIYPTDNADIYTATFTPSYSRCGIVFTIGGTEYSMFGWRELVTNGNLGSEPCTEGTTYQFTFDIKKLTYQMTPLTS